MRAAVRAALAGGLTVVLALAACSSYQPLFHDCNISCDTNAPCPDGFVCESSSGLCASAGVICGPGSGGAAGGGGGPDGGAGGSPGTGGVSGTGGGPPGAGGSGAGGTAGSSGMGGTGAGGGPECALGTSRCVSDTEVQPCSASRQWDLVTKCQFACVNDACGGSCVPGSRACMGNAARTCNSSGGYDLPVACPLNSPPYPVCAGGNCAYYAGLRTNGTVTLALPPDYLYALRFQTGTASARISRLGLQGMASGGMVRLGIYSEIAGPNPDMLLQSTGAFSVQGGFIDAPLGAPITLSANSSYWIAAIAQTSVDLGSQSGGSGVLFSSNALGWNVLPGTFPGGGATSMAQTPVFFAVLQDQ